MRERERKREEVEEREGGIAAKRSGTGVENQTYPPLIRPRNRGEGHALTFSLETEMEL